MANISSVLRFRKGAVRAIPVVTAFVIACASTVPTKEKVTLKGGEMYEVETVRGLPIRFANDQIKVRDLGITARFRVDNANAPPFLWILLAELSETGRFLVTVTTPLDKTASATFEVSGPGRISSPFFPQADYPVIWEGMDQPGVHFFPFHFVFEEKQSKKRFEFTQWAQMDDRTWKESRQQIEKAKQEMLKKQ